MNIPNIQWDKVYEVACGVAAMIANIIKGGQMEQRKKYFLWAGYAAWLIAIIAMLAMMQGCGGAQRYSALAAAETATV